MTDQTNAAIMKPVDRVRAALAEAGYPDAHVWKNHLGDVEVDLLPTRNGVSSEACWMAFFVCGMVETCWPCWEAGWSDVECTHDLATSPRPRLTRANGRSSAQ